MWFLTAPDAFFPLVGLKKPSPEEVTSILESRKRTNSGTLRVVACVVLLVMGVQFVLSLFDPKIVPGSGLQVAYLGLFLAGCLVGGGFFLLWTLRPQTRGHLLFVRCLLVLGVGLTLCDLQLSGDFSTYTLVLMGTSLLYSARLPWYLVDFGVSWLLLLLGLTLVPPSVMGVNPVAATAVMTVVGIATGIILETRRIRTELLTVELGRRNQELKEVSLRDALTGLHNRRFLFEWLDKQVPLARRNKHPVSAALIDLDHFKEVNDNGGHETGDEVLRHTARWLEDSLRKSDVVARYGGEEFMVILPGTAPDQARLVLERCLHSFRIGRVPGWSRPVTFSAGLTALGPEESVKDLFQRADDLLYQAKDSGRDQVVQG